MPVHLVLREVKSVRKHTKTLRSYTLRTGNRTNLMQSADYSILNKVIRERRSIYPEQFDPDRTIPEEIIHQLLENANWAPTHGLTQPWYFSIFSGGGLKKLADYQSTLYKKTTPPEHFKKDKFEKLLKRPLLCSHIIGLGMKRQKTEKIPEIEEVEAVACAVQNMYLTATAYGVGCYWGSGGITYNDKAKSFFNLTQKDRLLGFLYIGYPKPDFERPPGFRKPIEDRTYWIK